MLEITDSARQLIRDAWRRGLVLVVSAPWRDYRWNGSLFARWQRVGDGIGPPGCIRMGDGDWVYLRADLLPDLRRRRIRLERHTVLGLWPGIAVRDLDPQPVPIDDGRLWPRLGRPGR